MRLDDFVLFDPQNNARTDLPKVNGNYIVTIRDIKLFPTHGIEIITPIFRGHHVIYTGVASKSLRNRIGSQHLGLNAGRSTLRQSIGCLMGFTQIPRDKSKLENGMVKFIEVEERALLEWIQKNLLFYYLPNSFPSELEDELIRIMNPPLNIQKNHNPVNTEIRDLIKCLRRKKPWLTKPNNPSF